MMILKSTFFVMVSKATSTVLMTTFSAPVPTA